MGFSVGITRENENRARPVWARFLRCTTLSYRAPSPESPVPLPHHPALLWGGCAAETDSGFKKVVQIDAMLITRIFIWPILIASYSALCAALLHTVF